MKNKIIKFIARNIINTMNPAKIYVVDCILTNVIITCHNTYSIKATIGIADIKRILYALFPI